MRVLFDQATPVPIRPYLTGHVVSTAARQGWSELDNGNLLNAAEAAGFDVLLRTDTNIRYQQNLEGRKIAIVVIRTQQWPELKPNVKFVVAAVNAATSGSYVEVPDDDRYDWARDAARQPLIDELHSRRSCRAYKARGKEAGSARPSRRSPRAHPLQSALPQAQLLRHQSAQPIARGSSLTAATNP
jgi:hypothetical protein